MGSIKRARGVLKLVHPGRYVEIHKKPIRAEEVMRRNPRHCITRPDVFKFPWIVVKPESVLLPGSVFLIVPYHTIYDLLKAKGQSNHHPPFSQQNQSPNNNHVYQQLKQDSPLSSQAGMSSKLQSHRQYIKGQFVKREKGGDWDERSQNKSLVELWPKVISYEDTKKKMDQELMDKSTFEFTPFVALQYYQNYSKDMGKEIPKKDVNLELVSDEHVSLLRSCFRRPDSIRKSLNLKVSFNISIEKEEQ